MRNFYQLPVLLELEGETVLEIHALRKEQVVDGLAVRHHRGLYARFWNVCPVMEVEGSAGLVDELDLVFVVSHRFTVGALENK